MTAVFRWYGRRRWRGAPVLPSLVSTYLNENQSIKFIKESINQSINQSIYQSIESINPNKTSSSRLCHTMIYVLTCLVQLYTCDPENYVSSSYTIFPLE